MTTKALPAFRKAQGLQGRHVLAMILAFFGAIFVVNGAMIYSALSTNTGLVSQEPYRKGIHYNDRIAADERQARLGWVGTVTAARDGHVTLAIAGQAGQAVQGLHIDGMVGRPSTNERDVQLAFTETGAGRYEAQAGALGEGNWMIAVDARLDATSEPVYRLRRRLWLKP